MRHKFFGNIAAFQRLACNLEFKKNMLLSVDEFELKVRFFGEKLFFGES
jgi:hypothetical protein